MPSPLITIIVLNWNKKDLTAVCIDSLRKMQYKSYEIIVVDNGSIDGSPAFFAERYSLDARISFVLLGDNYGFAGGMNRGVARALKTKSDFFMLLNNDTTVDPNCCSRFIEAANQYPAAGIFGPKIIQQDDPDKIWFAGGAMMLPLAQPIHYGLGKRDTGAFNTVRSCTFLTGCCLFIRRSVIERIGVFDEAFNKAFFEDMDLSHRATTAGIDLMYIPEAVIYHTGSQTIGYQSASYYFYLTKNRILFARKHCSGFIFWLVFMPFFLIGRVLVKSVSLALSGQWAAIVAIMRGIGWHLCHRCLPAEETLCA